MIKIQQTDNRNTTTKMEFYHLELNQNKINAKNPGLNEHWAIRNQLKIRFIMRRRKKNVYPLICFKFELTKKT